MSYPGAMQGDAWLADEERLGTVVRRVYGRALQRPGPPLVVALAATAALVGLRATRPPVYEAALHFRLDEGRVGDARFAPRPPRDIRQYIAALALTRARVAAVLRAHHVSERRLARDPDGAIADFREGVDISVIRDDFLVEREPDAEPRSAYVSVTLQGADPEKTRAILHDLGAGVLEAQRAQRGDRLQRGRDVFSDELARARAETGALQARLERARSRAGAGGPAAAAELAGLETEALAAIEREVALERRADEVAFDRAAEDRQLALTLSLFDEGVRTVSPPLDLLGLALRAALLLPALFGLAAAVAGAFDDRVYGAGDLALARIPVLGVLPRFPGDDVGALAARAGARLQGVPR